MDKNEFIDELNNISKQQQNPIMEKLYEDTFIDIYKNPIVKFELTHLKYEELFINDLDINATYKYELNKPSCGKFMTQYFFTNKIVLNIISITYKSVFNYIQNKYNIKFNGDTFIFSADSFHIYPTKNAYVNNIDKFYTKLNKKDTYLGLHFIFNELIFNKYYTNIQNLIFYQINNISKYTNMFIHMHFNDNIFNLISLLRYIFKQVIIIYILSPVIPNNRVSILCINKLHNVDENIINKIIHNSKQYNTIISQIMNQLQQNINNSILFVNEWIKLHKIQQQSILYKIVSYTKYY